MENEHRKPDQDDPAFIRLVRLGLELSTEVAGRGVGLGVSAGLGGDAAAILAGAAAGAVATRTLRKIGQEIAHWFIGQREAQRAGSLFVLTSKRIRDRLDSGERVRQDGFFDDETGRSAADEITEATFLAVQRDPQERKLPFYADLLASFAFDSDIDERYANLLVRLMRDLSFSQLCLLSLFGTQAVPLRPSNYTGVGNFDNDLAAVLLEVGELYRDNLLMPQGGGGGIPYGAITSIVPANTRLQGASHELYQRAGLVRLMDDPKTQDIAAILRRAP